MNWIRILAGLLALTIEHISPEIRQEIEDSIKRLWVKAKATANPWDNIGVMLLAGIFGVELEP